MMVIHFGENGIYARRARRLWFMTIACHQQTVTVQSVNVSAATTIAGEQYTFHL